MTAHGIYFVFLILLGFMLLEAVIIIAFKKQDYPTKDALASIGVALIKRVIDVGLAGVALTVLYAVYDHRIMTLRLVDDLWLIPVYFFALEFCYYWQHRMGHTIRWIWATHGVHHTSNYMNLTAATRLGWTSMLSGNLLFYTPLAYLGFNPLLIAVSMALSLVYAFFLHTEVVGKLGFLDIIFNTPSNHRVHHGRNPQYIDKNFGGITVIFDHLFGTYQKEEEPVKYGLITPLESTNPFVIALREWGLMFKDVASAKNPIQGIARCFK